MKPKTLLLIAKNWPEPNSTAAGRRTLDLLELFRRSNYQIHIACAAQPSPFQADFSAFGYQTHAIAANSESFDTWVVQLDPTLVIYDRFIMEEQFGWRVRQQCPAAATLIDTSDLHCLRVARERAFKKEQPIELFSEIAVREISAITRCDATLMISTVEIDLLVNQFKISANKCLYLPFLIDSMPKPSSIKFEDRQHLVMVGGFKHEPNRDATRWLKNTLWPAMKSLLPKGTEMHVYGAYADHAMNQLHDHKKGFFIKGRVENSITTVEQYRLNLAPLRFGAGQKGKILEGWLTGTPTLTTAVGAEAMLGSKPSTYRLSEDPEIFAKTTAQYYCDKDDWLSLQNDGYDRIQDNFLSENHQPSFMTAMTDIIDNLVQRRAEDFWQSLVWQNQLGAMKYMSRWIEAKNKNSDLN